MTDEAGKPTFPPLFTGLAVAAPIDPFDKARSQAALGCDAGLVTHRITADELRAALVFAPEVPLEDAMAMLPVCGIGLQNALGALAPPEVAVHLSWQGGIYVNGAACGDFRMAAATSEPETVPDWLVVGLRLPLIPRDPDRPGDNPQETSLFDEGCSDVAPQDLLESWVRHTLVWINAWNDRGVAHIHQHWQPLARDVGEEVAIDWQGTALRGIFVGVDERFGMLLRTGNATQSLPLSGLLSMEDEP